MALNSTSAGLGASQFLIVFFFFLFSTHSTFRVLAGPLGSMSKLLEQGVTVNLQLGGKKDTL